MASIVWRGGSRMLLPLLASVFTQPLGLLRTVLAIKQSNEWSAEEGIADWQAIAVAPEAREGNNARNLVGALFKKLREEGCTKVRTATHGENVGVHHLHASLGFEVLKENKILGQTIKWK